MERSERVTRITSLAHRWATLPDQTDQKLESTSHEPFIEEFCALLMDDQWFVANYDMDRWSRECTTLRENPGALLTLNEVELRDFLTFCYRADRYCTGFLNSMAVAGAIQRVLLRFSQVIACPSG